MKVSMIISTLLAMAVAQPTPKAPATAPTTPAEWRPSGRLLLLPAHPENSPTTTTTEATTTTQKPKESQSDSSQSSRLQDSGEYYVLLPDGRLQMVKFMTAPLAQEKPETKEQQVQQQPEPFAQFQFEYLQFPHQYVSKPEAQKVETTSSQTEETEDPEEVSGFEANLQYREVKPISGPIYAYNPTPLVRILKK